ncbi:MAG: FAD-dependent monooxygenase [Reyranella sp.]|uniref:FAD-dependent oxidoreductase n=1 Tax=Reyranella sp. TaxID=1929291 RepID=UPI001AC361BB|nr:NAD(P)/FAD-dependent oxidoreductase [Reyranella sp.]MBN9089370.1 FAD-dependent monooxygenase [Reyranella sp.]
MSPTPDVVIAGGGIAGSALAAVLARGHVQVAVLEHDLAPVDRVRGESLAPWGVIELRRLGLYDALVGAGGVFTNLSVPHDENLPGEQALPFAQRFTDAVPEVPGMLCMSHPAMCRVLAAAAEAAGAVFLRGVTDIAVTAGGTGGAPPHIGFSHGGQRIAWTPRLIVGADGRNSPVRRQLGFTVHADPPHNLLGGMLVEGVPDWPQDRQVCGTEGRTHFLILPLGGDRVRLYLGYDFADRSAYAGAHRRQKLIDTFAGLACLPQASMIAAGRPIGPFNAFSNEDHWIDDPTAPGVVLAGDAAGHNDPIIGQGLAIALCDVRLLSEIIREGRRDPGAFRPYVEERAERMRRLRITARLRAKPNAEFGEEARQRRPRAARRVRDDKAPTPLGAILLGPEKLPAAFFEPSTIDALMAP